VRSSRLGPVRETVSRRTVLEPRWVGEIQGRFVVPQYQRGYRWGPVDVRRLLEDIHESSGETMSHHAFLFWACFDIEPDEGGRLVDQMLRVRPWTAGERAFILECWPATTLSAQVPAGSATLPVASFSGFPDQGTVRIGNELIHYTRRRAGALEMPRGSSRPGLDDRQGGGLFRGRYGTAAGSYAAGEIVILHPVRYWDRWTELADAPELSYFGFSLPQPDAFVESVFWQAEETGHFGPRLGLLQRTDPAVPWDADPGLTPGLDLYWEGMPNGAGNRLERSSSMAEWRLFVRYEPGSFDAAEGSAHGWKSAPNVTVFGTEYVAPGRRMWSVER